MNKIKVIVSSTIAIAIVSLAVIVGVDKQKQQSEPTRRTFTTSQLAKSKDVMEIAFTSESTAPGFDGFILGQPMPPIPRCVVRPSRGGARGVNYSNPDGTFDKCLTSALMGEGYDIKFGASRYTNVVVVDNKVAKIVIRAKDDPEQLQSIYRSNYGWFKGEFKYGSEFSFRSWTKKELVSIASVTRSEVFYMEMKHNKLYNELTAKNEQKRNQEDAKFRQFFK